jgi:hypothetical protein
MTMRPAARLKLVSQLEKQSGGKLEMFFGSYGLGRAYAAPGDGWGKAKHIASAITEADRRGNGEEVLLAAASYFGLEVYGATSGTVADEEDAHNEASNLTISRQDPPHRDPNSRRVRSSLGLSPEDELRQLAFEAWDATGEWPSARNLQRRTEQIGRRLDVDEAGAALDPRAGYLERSRDGRVVLKIRGLVGIHDAEPYVAAFLSVIQLAYRRYLEADATGTPTLSDEVLRNELGLDSDMGWRIYSLLDAEFLLLEGGGSVPVERSFQREISPNIRFFRDVKTADDYREVSDALLGASPRGIAAIPSASPSASLGEPVAASDRGNQVFHTVIFGGNAAIGPNAYVQVGVREGDLASLMAFLLEQGVDNADRDALKNAIELDEESDDDQRPGARVRDWLGRVSLKLAATGGRVTEQAGATLIAAAIAKYLGLL